MRIYTIGFAGKSAAAFFAKLKEAGVEKLIDIRRNSNTLYGGFTRARDLPHFLQQLCGIPYVHEPEFAPSAELQYVKATCALSAANACTIARPIPPVPPVTSTRLPPSPRSMVRA